MNNINVVYTPWANLKKTGDMDVGQIGFHRQREVSRNEKKKNPLNSKFCIIFTNCFTQMNGSITDGPRRVFYHGTVSQVKIVAVEKKINEIVNRLEKTKDERYPDLAAEKESRDREERNEKKAQLQEQKKKEKEEIKRKKEMEDLKYIKCFLIVYYGGLKLPNQK